MSVGALQLLADGRVQCSGRMTFDSVGELMRGADVLWQGEGELLVDLSAVNHSDSAGVALLVDWARTARVRGREIKFIHVPAQLWAIAEVSGLDRILPLQR